MRDTHERQSDTELVETCNRGGARDAAAAFGTLYERHRSFVLRIALRFVAERELAQDALQETFTYLLRQFPPTGKGLVLTARLTTYLYPIAKNFALTSARKSRRYEHADDALIEALPAGEESAPHRAESALGDDLDRALAGLTPERREVLSLRFVDDLSLEEIATALDIPLGTVKSRLHHAVKALRDDPAIKDLSAP
jgi:RNA polymerase sigma-70 factor (ECF subfamily)